MAPHTREEIPLQAEDHVVISRDTDRDRPREEERGSWAHSAEFVLSTVGFVVGIASVWRFPYVCMRNGGGAFLIPFGILIMLCGIPLFFLELILGQFSGLSPVTMWSICPIFRGLGHSMSIVSAIACVYLNVLLAYCLYYIGYSFTAIPSVPWASCDNWWNSFNCSVLDNSTLYGNKSSEELEVIRKLGASSEFWTNAVLQQTSSPSEIGGLHWPLCGCFFLTWVFLVLCLVKGVASSGKVVYVTATLPFALLIVFIIRGIMLPGSSIGLRFFLTPDFSRLTDTQVWLEAGVQVFFSLGPAWGGLITLASYNSFDYNCYKTAIMIPIVDAITGQ